MQTTYSHTLAETGEATKYVAEGKTLTITYWVIGRKSETCTTYKFGTDAEFGAAVVAVASL